LQNETRKNDIGSRISLLGLTLIFAGVAVFLLLMVQRSRERAQDAAYEAMVDTVTSDYDAEDVTLGTPTGSEVNGRKVLFLSSYDPTFLSYEDQIQGLMQVFDNSGVTLDVMDMDTKKHPDEADTVFADRMRERLQTTSYDGVIVGDDAALLFAEKYQDTFFKDIPIIFFGVSDYEEGEKAAENPYITGYLERDNFRETIDLALRLLPDTKKVVAIIDNTLSGETLEKNFEGAIDDPAYAGLTFETINFGDCTLSDLQNRLSQLTEGTVVLDVIAFEDADGISYTIPQSASVISKASPVPVFRTAKGGFKNGCMAGYVNLFENTAASAANLMMQFLDGTKDPKDQQLQEEMSACYVANYEVMEKFDVSEANLPADTVVLNRPETFNERYGLVFYPLALMLAGMVVIFLGLNREVSEKTHAEAEQRRISEELRFSSEHDSLTGILNRTTALDRLDTDERLRDGKSYAVALVDVDNFKEINEKYGHTSGDALLKLLAGELETLAKQTGAEIARYGGDEFLVVFFGRRVSENDPDLNAIMDLFCKERPMGIDYVTPHASIGVANAEVGHSAAELLVWAEMALQKAKQRGKNGCFVSSREMREDEGRYEQLKAAILHAIENDGMYMVYQPQVNTHTGQIEGLEALVRMQDADIGPGTFIPIAEENGWIRSIGRLTTRLVCEQIGKWLKGGITVPPISINYSAEQLQDTGYVEYLKGQLAKNNVPPDRIKIEITESLFMENSQRAEDLFHQFEDMGITLLMDDFGTGYSSLNYLSYIPVSVVKIDKTLVDTYMWDNDGIFLKDVIRLVHDLGKVAICEGVETKGQFDRLREFGCDSIQGYYFSRPLSADAASRTMEKGNLFHADDAPTEEPPIRLVQE